MAQAVGEFREVALEIGEVEHRCRFNVIRPYQPGSRPRLKGGEGMGASRQSTCVVTI
jgi:hypothetical protein